MNKFTQFTGQQLPAAAIDFIKPHDRAGHGTCVAAYYEGNDAATATNWIIVLDNGGYYKVNATYITWYYHPIDGVVGKCNWSRAALAETLAALLAGEQPPIDPDYHT